MIISKIKRPLRNLYNDNLINLVDQFHPIKGPLHKSGFKIYPDYIKSEPFIEGKNLLYKKVLDSTKVIDALSKITNLGGSINFHDHLLYSDFLLEVFNSNIIDDIRSYLGTGFKLDYTCLSIFNTFNGELKNCSSSGLFHHDSVGHRIKMFIPINEGGTINNPTTYLEGSNRIHWENFDNSEKEERLRIQKNKIEIYLSKEKKLGLNSNDILIFDTNGIHKGEYKQTNKNRAIIQFEFSKNKSYLKGLVGPASYYLSEEFYKRLKALNLLRLNRIKSINGNYLHIGKRKRNQMIRLREYL